MTFENIPQEMRALRQWVVWKLEDTGGKKPSKVPYNAIDGRRASPTNPQDWYSFDTVVQNVGLFSGIGFVLTEQDPFCIIDFDQAESQAELDLQIRLHKELDSYSEISPSGTGLHIVCKGALPTGRRYGAIEAYSSLRFMTMTGNVYNNTDIKYRQGLVSSIWENLNPSRNGKANGNPTLNEKANKTDLEVYNMAQYAENGMKFLALWNGDIHTYHGGDHSRADFALIDILAFYTQNREQITRLFRMSGLGRREKAKRQDYVENMISRSFDRIVPAIDVSAIANQVNEFMADNKNPQIHQIKTPREPLYSPKKLAEPPPAESLKVAKTIDEGAFRLPPGLLGRVAKFIYDQSYKPIPEIAMTGAVGYLAGIAGRAYNVSNTGLNAYILLLAGTGRGKEEIARGIGKLTRTVQHTMPTITDFLGPSDLASGQGLLRYMSDHPTKSFCSIFGEFGIKLKAISNAKSMASDLMLQRVMLDMFSKSGAADVLMATAYSDAERNTKPIESPAFSMIGESSPDWFYKHIDEEMIRTGLLPRFTIIEYEGPRPPSNYNSAAAVPNSQLVTELCTLATAVYKLLQARTPYEVPFDDIAHQCSVQLDKRCDDMINNSSNSIVAELWNRCHLKTMRIAALVAVGKNPYAPIIDEECWNWAEAFIYHGIKQLTSKFETGETGSNVDESLQVRVVVDCIIKYLVKDYDKVAGYGVSAAMYNARIIPYGYLQRYLRQNRAFKNDQLGPTIALKRAVQSLLDDGELQELSRPQAIKDFDFHGRCFAVRSMKILDELKNRIHLVDED